MQKQQSLKYAFLLFRSKLLYAGTDDDALEPRALCRPQSKIGRAVGGSTVLPLLDVIAEDASLRPRQPGGDHVSTHLIELIGSGVSLGKNP